MIYFQYAIELLKKIYVSTFDASKEAYHSTIESSKQIYFSAIESSKQTYQTSLAKTNRLLDTASIYSKIGYSLSSKGIYNLYHARSTYAAVMGVRELELGDFVSSLRVNMEQIINEQEQLSPRFMAYFSNRQAKGVPYLNLDLDPYQVSLIKKIINSMHYAEQAIVLFEANKKPNNEAIQEIILNLPALLTQGYEAMHTGAQSGLELMILFKPHLDKISEKLTNVQSQIPQKLAIKNYNNKQLEQALTIDSHVSGVEKIGQLFGVLMEQVNPEKPNDYPLFASVISTFPNIFEKAKIQLEKFSKEGLGKKSLLASRSYEDLQLEGQRLLKAVKAIDFKTLYHPANFINYYRLLEQLLTLYNVTILRFKELDTTSHKLIKESLLEAKTSVIAPLMMIADRIESTFVLKAGTISEPALVAASDYYQQGIEMFDFIDFKSDAIGCQAIDLVDDRFMQLRLDELQVSMSEYVANKAVIQGVVENALIEFYQLLEKHSSTQLGELAHDPKGMFLTNYQLLQKYFRQVSAELDSSVIDFLKKEQIGDFSYLHSELLKSKNDLINKLGQEKNTIIFQHCLEQDIKETVRNQLKFYMKQPKKHYLSTPLLRALPHKSLLESLEINGCVNSKDFFTLYSQLCLEKSLLEQALIAYEFFIKTMKNNLEDDINCFTPSEKEMLRRSYLRFQPFLLSLFGKKGAYINAQLTNTLNPNFAQSPMTMLIRSDKQLDKKLVIFQLHGVNGNFHGKIKQRLMALNDQIKGTYQLGVSCTNNASMLKDLSALSKEATAGHRSKLKVALSKIQMVKKKLDGYLKYLDPDAAELLKSDNFEEAPHPEVEEGTIIHGTPEQLLAIKQFKNMIYHLETAIKEVEALDTLGCLNVIKDTRGLHYIHKGFHSIYMIFALVSLSKVYSNNDSLQHDPYLVFLEKELLSASSALQAMVPSLANKQINAAHVADSTHNNLSDNIKLCIDYLYELPGTIKQLETGKRLTKEMNKQQSDDASNMKSQINELIEQSNSLVKLLWSLPAISGVFMSLKAQFNVLAGGSHTAIKANLKHIKTTCYYNILSKGAQLEMQLCAKKGAITDRSKLILDALFYAFLDKIDIASNERLMLRNDMTYLFKQRSSMTLLQGELALKLNRIDRHITTLNIIHLNIKNLKQQRSWLSAHLRIDANKEIKQLVSHFSLIRHEIEHRLKPYALQDDTLEKELANNDVMDEIEKVCQDFYGEMLNQQGTITLEKSLLTKQCLHLNEVERAKSSDFTKETKAFLIDEYKRQLKRNKSQLIHLNIEYDEKMILFFNTKKKNILNSARKDVAHIEANIENQFSDLRVEFNCMHLKSYQALDSIFSAIYAYRKKIDESALRLHKNARFKKKIIYLDKIEEIIKCEENSAAHRLMTVEKLFKSDDVKQTLGAGMSYSALSYEWFMSWYEYVLNCLHLFKTNEEQLLETIDEKLSPQPTQM